MPNRSHGVQTLAVLMPAHNALDRIELTVLSLRATNVPFDLFIVDDGSQVPLSEKLGKLPPNFHIVRLACNMGVAAALNHGLNEILRRGYIYIARIDAGDTAAPQRFEKQLDYLEKNPEVGLVGSWIRMVDETSRVPIFYLNPPTADVDIRAVLYYNSCVTHSAMMYRSKIIQQVGGYSTAYPVCEDYEILLRIASKARVANIPEYLTDCEVAASGLSLTKRRTQLRSRLRIQIAYLHPLRWRAWLGIVQTLLLLAVPNKMVQCIKVKLRSHRPASA